MIENIITNAVKVAPMTVVNRKSSSMVTGKKSVRCDSFDVAIYNSRAKMPNTTHTVNMQTDGIAVVDIKYSFVVKMFGILHDLVIAFLLRNGCGKVLVWEL